MNDQNPLQLTKSASAPSRSGKTLNKSGRPTMKNMIKFGPQPKSIIAQMMMSEIKAKTIIEEKEDIITLDGDSDDSSASNKSDHINSSIPTPGFKITTDEKKTPPKAETFSCDFPNCSYVCKLYSNLIKHKRVHTNEKPYLCEKCSFRSNFVNSLKAHKRTHTLERPYQCTHCNYKCNSSSNLKKHCHHRHPNVSNNSQHAKT